MKYFKINVVALICLVFSPFAFGQSGCNDLDVTSTQDGSVCGGGRIMLEAVGSGNGDEVVWFESDDTSNDTIPLGTGTEFQTPVLNSNTDYWVSEALRPATKQGKVGPIDPSIGTATGSSIAIGTQRLYFDVLDPVTLLSVDIYPTASVGSQGSVTIRDDNQNVLHDIPYTTTVTGGNTAQTIPLNVSLPVGTDYEIGQGGDISLMRNSTGATYPYNSSRISITGQSYDSGYYYSFYNWKFTDFVLDCESSRKKVTATVDNSADVVVNEPLPYTDNGKTKDYDNNYVGEAGRVCERGDYLDGNDVVYQYSPSQGGVYSIELSDLSSDNAAVFVYESCFDIGDACYAGEVSDGSSSDFGIDEVIMNDGHTYFILISTEHSSSTDYTLTIDEAQIDCVDYTEAPEGEEVQYSRPGFTLEDLDVKGSNLTWYDDNTLGSTLPETIPIINNTTYYVTQTLNGCVSDDLKITAYEVDCNGLEVTSFESDTLICHGMATLKATGTDTPNTELYWYKNDTIEDKLALGSTFVTPELNNTTSYWVSEVFFEGQTEESGYGKDAPAGTQAFSSPLNYGLEFDVIEDIWLALMFILMRAER